MCSSDLSPRPSALGASAPPTPPRLSVPQPLAAPTPPPGRYSRPRSAPGRSRPLRVPERNRDPAPALVRAVTLRLPALSPPAGHLAQVACPP